jgi:hypothetical protein
LAIVDRSCGKTDELFMVFIIMMAFFSSHSRAPRTWLALQMRANTYQGHSGVKELTQNRELDG